MSKWWYIQIHSIRYIHMYPIDPNKVGRKMRAPSVRLAQVRVISPKEEGGGLVGGRQGGHACQLTTYLVILNFFLVYCFFAFRLRILLSSVLHHVMTLK